MGEKQRRPRHYPFYCSDLHVKSAKEQLTCVEEGRDEGGAVAISAKECLQ